MTLKIATIYVLAVSFSVIVSSSALASGSISGTSQVEMLGLAAGSETLACFEISGTIAGGPSCASGDTTHFCFLLNTPKGKGHFRLLNKALLTGATIDGGGNDFCDPVSGGTEMLEWLELNEL